MKRSTLRGIALAWLGVLAPAISMAQAAPRITILVDAFGTPSPLYQDWGFSALIEYGGKRILFDTGNNADFFAHNTRLLGVDLTRLDAVVISHRHNDHTDGLHHLLQLNPHVAIYAPDDEYFGGPTPAAFFRDSIPSLPRHLRYFGGTPPKSLPHGSPWKHAMIERVDSVREIAPGIRVVRNRSSAHGFPETPEISLSIQTPEGQILLVGCSHPGIEQILSSVGAKQVPVRLLVGGLHLLTTSEAEVDRVVQALLEEWGIGEIAPGHCTGERAFMRLQRVFGNRFRYAGVGTVIELP